MQKAASIITHHQASGRIGPGDPLQKVVLLISPLMVAGILARSGAKLPVAEPDVSTIVERFLDGHGAGQVAPRRRSGIPRRASGERLAALDKAPEITHNSGQLNPPARRPRRRIARHCQGGFAGLVPA